MTLSQLFLSALSWEKVLLQLMSLFSGYFELVNKACWTSEVVVGSQMHQITNEWLCSLKSLNAFGVVVVRYGQSQTDASENLLLFVQTGECLHMTMMKKQRKGGRLFFLLYILLFYILYRL